MHALSETSWYVKRTAAGPSSAAGSASLFQRGQACGQNHSLLEAAHWPFSSSYNIIGHGASLVSCLPTVWAAA